MHPQKVRKAKVNRLRIGLTLDELSRATGLSRGYLSEYERGLRNLRPDQQRLVEKALGREPSGAAEEPEAA